jgi:hypothetical protein
VQLAGWRVLQVIIEIIRLGISLSTGTLTSWLAAVGHNLLSF